MAWDNIANIWAATNRFTVAGDLTAKYRAGKRVKVRGTSKSNGIHKILSSTYSAGQTGIVVSTDITETVSSVGLIAIRRRARIKGRPRKRRDIKPATKRARRKMPLRLKGQYS